jgi:hypothetical protein
MSVVDWFWQKAYIYSVVFLVIEGAVLFTWGLYCLVEYVRKELSR